MNRPPTPSGARRLSWPWVLALACGFAVVVTAVAVGVGTLMMPRRVAPDAVPESRVAPELLPCGTTVWNPQPTPSHTASIAIAPRKLHHASAVYPPAARDARIEGNVIIQLTLDCTGAVAEAHVLRSIPLLDQAALDAVRQWRYAPTLHDGQRVPILMTVVVNFTLQT